MAPGVRNVLLIIRPREHVSGLDRGLFYDAVASIGRMTTDELERISKEAVVA
jgi:hypothetical protein